MNSLFQTRPSTHTHWQIFAPLFSNYFLMFATLLFLLPIRGTKAQGDCISPFDFTHTNESVSAITFPGGGTTRAASMLPCKDGVSPRSNGGEPWREQVENMQKEENQRFTIAPNPADDMVNIIFKEPFTGNITLLDVTGRVVQQHILNAATMFAFDTQKLPNGIYYLQSQGDGQKPKSTKLVITH